jgi:beta-N-acetylhexosaminidase
MPGHGRAFADSHKELPTVHADLDTLDAWDFAPFKSLSDMPIGMTAHIVFEAIDPDQPATTSAPVMQVIRDVIGFNGLIMTDDLSMQALSGSLADRARAAHGAGCDIILHCNGIQADMIEVAGATPLMSEAAMGRGKAALALRQAPELADIPALVAELDRLLTGPA